MEQSAQKKRKPFLAITLAVLIVLTTLLWSITTSWGNVQVKRTYIFADNGDRVSVIMYIPKTATNKTPAPVVQSL